MLRFDFVLICVIGDRELRQKSRRAAGSVCDNEKDVDDAIEVDDNDT